MRRFSCTVCCWLAGVLITSASPMALAARGAQMGGGVEWQRLSQSLSDALSRGDLELSETIARQRLTMAQNGPDRWLGNAYRGLSAVLVRRGRYVEAEAMLRKALPIVERENGRLSHQAIRTQSTLVALLTTASRLAEADALAREALERQMNVAPQGIEVVTLNNQLGNIQRKLGKLDEAEAFFERAERTEVSLVPLNAGDTGTNVQTLAIRRAQTAYFRGQLEMRRQQFGQAESWARRALEILSTGVSENHPERVRNKILQGEALLRIGRLSEAETLFRSVMGTVEQVNGRSSREAANAAYGLGLVLAAEKRPAEAEFFFRQALQSSRQSGALDLFVQVIWFYAGFLERRGRLLEALPMRREGLDAIDRLFVQTRGLDEITREGFMRKYGAFYGETLKTLLALDQQYPKGGYDREALAVVSRTQSRIFTEMLRQADVAGLKADPLFQRLRGRQDELKERLAEQRRVRVMAVRDEEGAGSDAEGKTEASERGRLDAVRADLEAKLAATVRELEAVEAELWASYPRYMELVQPRPITVEQLQQRVLKPGETLLTYYLLQKETLAFRVTRERFQLLRLPSGRDDIAALVTAVRAPEEVSGGGLEHLKRLDPALLNRLYQILFQPLEGGFRKGQNLLVIGDGPLHTLPLEMLVTRYGEAERSAFEQKRQEGKIELAEYGTLPYLARNYRFSYLPSLSALVSLRLYRKPPVSYDKNLVSFADPLFETQEESTLALTRQLRGGSGPAIPRLPETADEARDIAAIVGGRNEIFLRAQAQEHTAKALNLKTTRYVHFATHGLLGGEFVRVREWLSGGHGGVGTGLTDDEVVEAAAERLRKPAFLAEPALVLSLSGDLQGEDGLLTMHEVVERMDLNARLVVLSACNTVGEGGRPGSGEGFAGLTRAFMFAGAQGLLVSHWGVESRATRDLMTDTFRGLQRGESNLAAIDAARTTLRESVVEQDGRPLARAHPFFWAPFVYVGE